MRRRTQAERTALSDKRMFEAAIKLINERGTAQTTLKEIGEMAGYSRGLAHSRFGSKAGFFSHLFSCFDSRWNTHLEEYVDGKTGIEAVVSILHAVQDFLAVEGTYTRAMYILCYESLGRDSDIREKLVDNHRTYRDNFSHWIRSGIQSGEIAEEINPDLFGLSLNSFIFGTIYQWLVKPDELDLTAIFEDYEKTVRRVLLARREG